MKRLKENTNYSQKELFVILGITQYTWDRRRDEWLEHFKTLCEYEITYGPRGTYIFLIKVILEDEYIPLPRQKNVQSRASLIQKDYDRQVTTEIHKYPFQTVNTLAHRAQNGEYTAQYQHSDYTSKKYVRNTINNPNLIHIKTRVWMRPCEDNTFMYLTAEELAYLKAKFSQYFDGIKKNQENIYASIDNGEYTKEEGIKLAGELGWGAYWQALNDFTAQYGFTPKKILEYELNVFDNTDLDLSKSI